MRIIYLKATKKCEKSASSEAWDAKRRAMILAYRKRVDEMRKQLRDERRSKDGSK